MPKQIGKVKVMGSDGKIYERTPCEVYLRVMGYLRPLSGFNIGKRAEAYSRAYFLENAVDNSKFLARYKATQNA